ncbi:MAG TPA: LacI family DNA-binding transcriptional regulator [Flavobacteriaceae bacterium]|nr:LacI family DNA-binding transcriptional regulator [Flavobacteriaceae bacterium]
MQKPTLKSIARELGVSVSTVSKALKGSDEISDATKDKIQSFARHYNYKPNNIALSLKNRKTKTIGIIIPDIVHYFFTTVISGVEEVANKAGYNVIIGLSNESFQKEVINMEMLANGSIDGFILSVSKETLLLKDFHHIQETINQGMPVVIFDRWVDSIMCDRVIIDDVESAKKAVVQLYEFGCKNIAIITTEDHVSVGRLRTQGYKEALQEFAQNQQKEYILKLNEDLYDPANNKTLIDTVQSFIQKNPEIDGIFAVNEVYALSSIRAAINNGKSVPGDIKIIGFTDGLLSKYAVPSLSTISQHGKLMGMKAAETLIERLESDVEDLPYKTLILETELIERETTAKI